MIQSRIKSTGMYVPPNLVTNNDLEKIIDTSDEWIRQRTGIEQRYWIEPDKVTGAADLGFEASKIALEKAGWDASDLDFIIFATLSPDIMFPGSGCLLQAKLGLDATPTLDIRQQCTGFLYGLATADAYIKTGMAKKILFVGGEVHSSGLDKRTRGRDVTVIFGDGAGALCIEAVETQENAAGVLASSLHSDGNWAEALMTELPASRLPDRHPKDVPLDDPRYFPVMDGPAIFKKAVKLLPGVIKESLEKAQITLDQIDLLIPHQANMRINQAMGQFLKFDDNKVFHNIQKYGNTTAASIPIALHEAMEQGRIGKEGDIVLFAGLGAGLTWGSMIYKFF